MERRLIPPRNDVLVAVGFMTLAVVEVWLNHAVTPRWAALPIALVAAASLAWRREYPLAVTVVTSLAMALDSIAGVPIQEPIIPLVCLTVAAYSLVVHAPATRVLAGLAVLGIGIAVAVTSQNKGVGNFVFGMAWVALAMFIGRIVRMRNDEARMHAQRVQRLEHEQRERVEAAAREERKRIARELHDVIAHSLSVMVVQAGAAEEMLRHDPARAYQPVLSIQQTGREALAEMSRLLGVLREHGPDSGLTPQPGLGELETLIDETRAVGMPVELTIEGHRRALPIGVELAAYRIVQEALTNARKYAGDVHTTVTVHYGEDTLDVDVADDGHATTNGDGGLGLVGMRERVLVFGGSLETGPRPGGGFGVHAQLPLGDAT